ncbi:hypothetical protein EDB85DRAFT_2034007 [Lactarius pseudohatsudake]|nr:hypothetical protein EDB85DRAFT_2034007 [Lactarius pseudohatsudake]
MIAGSGALNKKRLCQSREHAPQKVAARHAPAVFPPADPHPGRGATRNPPLLKAIHHSRGRPNGSAQRADGGGAHHGEPPQARPAHLRPYQYTLRDSIAKNSDGSVGAAAGKPRGHRRRRGETRAQLDEHPCDEDGEDERRGGCAEHGCLRRRYLLAAVRATRWGRCKVRAATIGRRKGGSRAGGGRYTTLRALAAHHQTEYCRIVRRIIVEMSVDRARW